LEERPKILAGQFNAALCAHPTVCKITQYLKRTRVGLLKLLG